MGGGIPTHRISSCSCSCLLLSGVAMTYSAGKKPFGSKVNYFSLGTNHPKTVSLSSHHPCSFSDLSSFLLIPRVELGALNI